MTSREFVIWLRGFVEACNDLTATPAQWDLIRDTLAKVDDNFFTYRYQTSENSTSTVNLNKKQKQQLND